jgi:hypothetical protein
MAFDWDAAMAPPDDTPTTKPKTFDWDAAMAPPDDSEATTPASFDWDKAMAPPDATPPPEKPGILSRIGTGISDAVHAYNDAWNKSAEFGKDLLTESGRAKLYADPETAGAAGAVLSPINIFSGQGETPLAATARENLQRTGNVGVGNENTATMEGIAGGATRIMSTGGFAPLVEMAVKAGQIHNNEPNRPLLGLGSLGRIAAAGAATYIPAKAGAAVEPLVAKLGLGRIGGFLANAGIDAGIGAGAGTAQKAAEMLGTGVPAGSDEFKQGLMPTVADAAMIIPSAVAAGMGGAHEAYSRSPEGMERATTNAGWDNATPVVTPDRAIDIQQAAEDQVTGAQDMAMMRTLDRELAAKQAENAPIAEQANRMKDELNPSPELTPDQKLLPAPDAETLNQYTAGPDPGVHVGSNDGMPGEGDQLPPLQFDEEVKPDGSEQRKEQGQTPGVAPAVAVPTSQAGTGVINLPAANGNRVGLGGLGMGRNRDRTNGASEPITPATEMNPDLGELKVGTLQDEGTQQAVKNMSQTDTEDLQAARRGTVPVQQSIDAGTKLAESKGESLVANWKPGQSFNAEQLVAVKAHAQGVTRQIADAQAEFDKTGDPKSREMLFTLHQKQFDAIRSMVATKSEAGRALNILRHSIGPADGAIDAAGNKIVPTDKTRAVDYLTKLYGDKPVPDSVQKQIADLHPDDVAGLVDVLAHQTKVNNKTSFGDALVNTFKAGMLTSVRMLERNDIGLATKTLADRGIGQQISSAVDYLLGARSGVRTIAGVNPLRSLSNLGKTAKEVGPEMLAMMKGKFTPEMVKEAADKFEFTRDQYTGDKLHNRALDLYVNSVFRMAGAIDLPFRKFNFMESISDQAKLIALNEAKAGAIKRSAVGSRTQQLINNPTDAMTLEAAQYSEGMVYADKNMVATGMNQLGLGLASKIGQRSKTAGVAVKMAQASTMPFMKVGMNIAWDVIEKAAVSSFKVLDQAPGIAKKSIQKTLTPEEQKAFARAVGNGGVGAGAILTGMILAAKGLMTGSSQNETSPTRQTDEVAGRQSGAVLIGGKWRRIQDVGSPVSNLMVLGASMYREWSKPREDETKRAGNIGLAAASAVLDNPIYQGTQDIVRIGQNGPAKFIGQKIGAAVPAFVNDIGALTDKYRRDAKPSANEPFLSGIGTQVQSRLPGLRNRLPMRVNAFGEPETQNARDVFDATFPQDARDKADPAIKELVRLNIGLQQPKKKPEESNDQFIKRAGDRGALLHSLLIQRTSDPDYANQSDAMKRVILEKIVKGVPINP